MALPVDIYILVCKQVAFDPDPLHSLSRRMATLGAIAACSRELYQIVNAVIYPAMTQMMMTPMMTPGVDVHGDKPTIETLARLSDASIEALVVKLGAVPMSTRSDDVDTVLRLTPSRWHHMNLRAELCRRRALMMTALDARVRYRLRPPDIEKIRSRPGTLLRKEDVLDASYDRFGGTKALQVHASRMQDVARVRAATLQAQRLRRDQVCPELRLLAQTHDDLAKALKTFTSSGMQAHKEQLIRLYTEICVAIEQRRIHMGVLPPSPPRVQAAYQAYICYGREEDLTRVAAYIREWQWVMEESQDVHVDLVRSSVEAHLLQWQNDPAPMSDELGAMRAHMRRKICNWRSLQDAARAKLTQRCLGPRATMRLDGCHLSRGCGNVDTIVQLAERTALCEFYKDVRRACGGRCHMVSTIDPRPPFCDVVREAFDRDDLDREQAVALAVAQLSLVGACNARSRCTSCEVNMAASNCVASCCRVCCDATTCQSHKRMDQ